jgi:hypothetical protein
VSWRVGLIDSCGGALEGIDAAPFHDASWVAEAAAFVAHDGRVECRETVADPTGHGSRIAELLISGRSVELLLGQVFTTMGPASGAAVAAAIDWAVERRAGLIHLSLGLAGDRAVLGLAVQRAIDAGCILVAATPARGASVYPAAYPGVIRATGDARCAPHEVSALRPWFFGGCPRLEAASRAAHDGTTNGWAANTLAEHRASGGASIGAAWVSHALVQQPALAASAAVDALTARAKYRGPERRMPADRNQNL